MGPGHNAAIALDRHHEDAGGVPTMLLSAFLGTEHEEARFSPEQFAAFLQDAFNEYRSKNATNVNVEYRCEVWASAPAPLPLTKVGGDSIAADKTSNHPKHRSLRVLRSEFRTKGLCVLPGVLSCSETTNDDDDHDSSVLERVQSLVHWHIQTAEAAIAKNHPQILLGEDSFLFREMASRSKQRFDLLVPRDTELYKLVRERVFGSEGEMAEAGGGIGSRNAFASELLQRLFLDRDEAGASEGSAAAADWDMDLSVVYSKPGANHQGWHADGAHADGAPDAGWSSECEPGSSNGSTGDAFALSLAAPYALCWFVPLVDLDHTVGFTQFWPGSHRHRALVGFGPFAEVAGATWDRIVPAGDPVCYDYRLLHRGMPNKSDALVAKANGGGESTPLPPPFIAGYFRPPYRPVLQLLCRRTWYKEKNNYGSESIYEPSSL
ncbi:unnamed protein product [Pseudo-nitzschia multistriata]|uniref:Uncharacterized protein n=1 Tax=Pseudo-nitzschia multistriata TaxID=183589 RepID=A0A448Z084_9STRA|nr:unnamed protein product [Pseudo-nitzschia multistriata]